MWCWRVAILEAGIGHNVSEGRGRCIRRTFGHEARHRSVPALVHMEFLDALAAAAQDGTS